MPKRHGIYQTPQQPPVFRYGVVRLFESLRAFVATGKFTGKDGPAEIKRPELPQVAQLRSHFIETTSRLLHSLDELQQAAGELRQCWEGLQYAQSLSAGRAAGMRAAVAAEGAIHYLNVFLDDIARLVPFLLECDLGVYAWDSPKESKRIDSFSRAVAKRDEPPFAPVKELFAALDKEGSWWKRGFGRGVGLRQRVVHYPDLLSFQGAGTAGSFEVQAYLISPFIKQGAVDFIGGLREVLHGMCEWLDEAEAMLVEQAQQRARAGGTEWSPPASVPSLLLPVAPRTLNVALPPVDYLYLPMCEESAPLVKTISYSVGHPPG